MSGEPPTRLAGYFKGPPTEAQASLGEDVWRDDFKPWDRGGPSVALHDALIDHARSIGSGEKSREGRRLALVPGCGTGYDVCLLASFGYDVWGVDASETAVKRAQEFARQFRSGAVEAEVDDIYSVKYRELGQGTTTFLSADFFDNAWTEEVKASQQSWK